MKWAAENVILSQRARQYEYYIETTKKITTYKLFSSKMDSFIFESRVEYVLAAL